MGDHVVVDALVGLVAGSVLGLGFFGALLLTVRALPRVRHQAMLALASLLVRLALLAGGLLLLVDGGIPTLAAAVVGLLAARTLLVRRTAAPDSGGRSGGASWT